MKLTVSLGSTGPEKLTLIERFANVFPLPYTLSAFILAVLSGPPLQFLSAYLDTNNLDLAFKNTLNTSFSSAGSGVAISTWLGATEQTLWFLTIFVGIYSVRFMRLRIVKEEPELAHLMPSGEETFHRAFGAVSNPLPQVLLSVVFFLISIPYFLSPTAKIGPIFLVYQLGSNGVLSVIFSGFLWMYFRSLWGVYKLGKEPLKLRPYREDHMLGVRPIGSIALTLFVAFILVASFNTIGLLLSPDPISVVVLSGFLTFGVAMFFLPLNSIHKTMAEEKRNLISKVQEKFALLVALAGDEDSGKTETLLRRLWDTQLLQIDREYISNVPTWPFDTPILGKFAAVALSVVAILISKLVALPFHI